MILTGENMRKQTATNCKPVFVDTELVLGHLAIVSL